MPDKDRFQEIYQGKPPWDIGKLQSVFVQAADQITGSVLDVGCGTGENGIDFLEQPIAEATRKAHQRGLDATFLVMDALRLEDLPEVSDSALDCGLFHVFSDEDRSNYVASLSTVVKPGGRLFLACFSDKEPPGEGPRQRSNNRRCDRQD